MTAPFRNSVPSVIARLRETDGVGAEFPRQSTGDARFLERLDVVAMWDVGLALAAGSTNARTLWSLRDSPDLATEFLAALDCLVGLASRRLLPPADWPLQRVARTV